MQDNETSIKGNYKSIFGNYTSMHGNDTWIHDNVTLVYWNDTGNHGNNSRIYDNDQWIYGNGTRTYEKDILEQGNETSVYGNNTGVNSIDTLIYENNTWNQGNDTVIGENFTITIYIYGIVAPIVIIIGLIINLLCALAINMEKKKTSNDILILSWTMADLSTFIGAFVLVIKTVITIGFPGLKISHGDILLSDLWITFLYKYPVSISKVIVAMLALERFTAIYLPLKFRIIWTGRFTTIVSICTFIFPVVLFISLRIFVGNVIADVICTLTLTIISITVTAVFNIISLHGIMKNNKFIKGLTESQKQKRLESEKKWNKVLIGASVLTIGCNLPALAQNICIVGFEKSWNTERLNLFWTVLVIVSLIFHIFLSCSNCFILVLNNDKYMASVMSILRCKRDESG